MSSQASRTSFSKFTLKPSALSQLTANFNRKLEEIEVPKIEPIDLIGREANSHSNQENINKDGTKTDGTEGTSSTSSNQAAAPSKEFIFGENITERVVNKPESTSTSAAATGEGGESTAEATSEATNGESDDKTGEKQTSSNLPTTSSSNNISSWLNDSENTEKYAAALHESDLYTLCKLNCKLYVLEADKANWLERGYGILKVIETNDGNNCKIMMWTDKCFRVILNTKFFEKMKIDRANNKSLRFNAFDNGTIRIFLIKATNQNDCDELQNVLSSRLELFLSTLQSSKSSASNSQEADVDDSTSRTSRKVTKFKCDCTVSRESNPSQSIRAKIHLYMLEAGSSDSVTSPPPPSNSHQLFLEINEAFDSDQKINLNSYLKLVKIKKQKITPGKKGHKYLKFEIVDLAQAKSNIKYNVCINDRASASQFFSLYKKEPKFTSPDDSSSNGTNAFDKDLDDDQQEGVENEEDEEEDSEESDENEDEDDDGEKSSSSSASSRSRPRSPPSNDDDSLLDRTNNSSITAATNDETSASNVLKRKSDVSDSDVRLAKKPGLDESAVASEDKSEEKSEEKKDEVEEKKDEGEEKKEASESVPVVPTAAAASCGGGGTKRNLEESVTSEGGDDSTAADENEGSKKTKVSTEETSQD